MFVLSSAIIRHPIEETIMADNRKKRGEPDRSTINMNEDYEKEYWKKKFRVSGQALPARSAQSERAPRRSRRISKIVTARAW